MNDKKGGLLIIVMGVVIVLLIAVIGTQFYMITQISANTSKVEEGQKNEHDKEKKTGVTVEDIEILGSGGGHGEGGGTVASQTFILSDSQGGRYILKTTVFIGINKKSKEYKEKAELLGEKQTIIDDIVGRTIRSKNYDEYLAKGEEFFEGLKKEIITKLNEEFDTDIVVSVYFKEPLTQKMN